MKQIWPDYSYSPATNVLTLTGLNIDRDQLLLVTAADRGRIMYNFADSSVTASAFTSGANTALTLVATTAGLTTTAALVIYFDDQATSSTVTGTVELGPTSLNALESITVTMGQVTVTGGLTDVQLRASPVTVGGTVTVGNFPASQAVTFAAVTGSVSVLNFPASQGVTFSAVSISNFPATQPVSIASVTIGNTVTIAGTVTANPTGTQTIAGTVTANIDQASLASSFENYADSYSSQFPVGIDQTGFGDVPISGTVTVGNSVTIASLPSLAAGTAQIGSVTASVTNPVTVGAIVGPIGGSVFKGGSGSTDAIRALPYFSQNGSANYNELSTNNPLPIAGTITIGSLPAISGTVTANVTILDTNSGSNVVFSEDEGIFPDYGLQVGFVDNLDYRLAGSSHPFPISGTVTVGNSVTIASLPAISGTVTANLSISSTVITSGSFSSLSSATLVPANPARKMATVYNLGAGQLFVNAGATATTLGGGFMVALSSGDFYECDYTTTTLSAIFATAGTASWMSH
jgi:hypothetical protein